MRVDLGRVTASLVAVWIASSCGTGGSHPTTTPTTAVVRTPLVEEKRAVSKAELARLQNNHGADALGCSQPAPTWWDYGAIGPSDPRGRQPEDALKNALVDMNRSMGRAGLALLPFGGWIELIGTDRWFVHARPDGAWDAMVIVQGDPAKGIWRNTFALTCREPR